MTHPPPPCELTRASFGLLFLAILIAASFWVLRPVLPALVWATMIVLATWPLLLGLQARLGGRRAPTVVATFGILFLLGLACAASSAAAATAADAPDADVADGDKGVTLRYFNRDLMVFRAQLFGYDPAERVEGARKRLDLILAADPARFVVDTKATDYGQAVQVNGSMVFFVTPGDVDVIGGETLETVLERAQSRLRATLDGARAQRSGEVMFRGLALVALATTIFFLLQRFGRRGLNAVQTRADAAVGRALGKKLTGLDLVRRERLSDLIRWCRNALGVALGLALTYVWITFSLKQFPYTAPWGEGLQDFLISTASTFANGILGAVPGLLVIGLIAWLTWVAIRFSNYTFKRVEQGSIELPFVDRDTAALTRKLVAVVFVLFSLAAAYPYLPGANSDAFKGLSVLAGLMISIGASSVVGQAASGLILVYSRAFKPGDFVAIGEHEGRITGIGMFSTRLQTLSGEVALSNALVIGSSVRNYSRAGGHGVAATTGVTIGYDTPWRQVHAMLLEAAARTPGIAGDPEPYVRQTALSDFYVEYKLVATAHAASETNRAEIMSLLHGNILDVFNEYGVQIMSPHYEGDPARDKIVPRAAWAPPPAKPEADGLGERGETT